MKPAFATFLVGAFIAVAVFGVFAMNLEAKAGHVSCIAQTVQGAVCPESNGPLAFIGFHLSAFKSFSTAVFGLSSLVTILLTLVLLTISGFICRDIFSPKNFSFTARSRESSEPILSKRQFIHWLALHENSPSFA